MVSCSRVTYPGWLGHGTTRRLRERTVLAAAFSTLAAQWGTVRAFCAEHQVGEASFFAGDARSRSRDRQHAIQRDREHAGACAALFSATAAASPAAASPPPRHSPRHGRGGHKPGDRTLRDGVRRTDREVIVEGPSMKGATATRRGRTRNLCGCGFAERRDVMGGKRSYQPAVCA
jgi:hypothetical protein